MNDIIFLRETMTTVILKVETKTKYHEIFEKIPLGYAVFGNDTEICAKYYKETDGSLCIQGHCSFEVKCFPRTMTFYCKTSIREFKIRWFYSKTTNKIHLASGLRQDVAAKYLLKLVFFVQHKIECNIIESVNLVLANGMAQAKNGVNLYSLAKVLKDASIKFVYTPDNHAALKIYTDKGTVCVFSTGKILYMGSKTQKQLMELHQYISLLGKHWEGVPIQL